MVDSPFIEVFKTHVARVLEDMFSGEHGDGSAGLTIGLGDLIGLFQSLWFYGPDLWNGQKDHQWAVTLETARSGLQGMTAYRGIHSVCLLDLPLGLGIMFYVMSECKLVHAVIEKVDAVKLKNTFK